MTKGFFEREGIDFKEVFAPVARIETIRIIVGITNNHNWPIKWMPNTRF